MSESSQASGAVDPRREALDRVGRRFDARVLEPSPPADDEAPWFADDPVTGEGYPDRPDRPVVAPVPAPAATTWDELTRGEPDLAPWCADRWLGAWRALALPADVDALERTRRSWHMLAEHVVAPARYRANGKIGLRFTRGGFGTPFFSDDRQVRVEGESIVVTHDGRAAVHPITTASAAATAAGIEPGAPTEVYTPSTKLDLETSLAVDVGAARFLGEWFGFGASVLEELRAAADPKVDAPARVQLWPEHFDLSVDLGDEVSGRRATFGASPGDDAHPVPYVYVSPWAQQTGDFWNETTFASLSLASFAAAPDQRRAALDYFEQARQRLDPGRG